MANNSLKIFETYRIRTEELIQDSLEFLIDKFKQARRMFTVSSVYGQILYVLKNLSHLIFYYIEDSITELNINQATRNSSRYSLISLAGHNPTRSIEASGEIKIKPKDSIEIDVPGNLAIIPNYSRINCLNNNLTYVLKFPGDELRVPLQEINEINVTVYQGRFESQTFTGKGQRFESVNVPVPRNFFVSEYMVDVYVNDTKWKRYDNLLKIPKGTNGYMIRTGVTSGVDIFFGNDNFGKTVNIGDTIRVDYLVTDGFAGRVAVREPDNVAWEFVDTAFTVLGEEIDMNEVLDVTTNVIPDFGANPEPIELSIKALSKGNDALIRLDNYEVLLERLDWFSIIKVFQDKTDERMVNLFLVPDISRVLTTTQTYFNIPLTDFILSDTKKNQLLQYIEKTGTKLISTDVKIIDPVMTKYIINVSLVVYEEYDVNIIKNNVTLEISDYFMTVSRKDRIPRSDLVRIIENVDGVDSVAVNIVGENNEKAKISNPDATEVGLDEFNDIIIGVDELPVIRGGWKDRYGNIYDEGISDDGLGALNIRISDIIQEPKK